MSLSRPESGLDPERLRQVTLFAPLSAPTLRRITELAAVHAHRANEHIVLEGDECRAGYFILSGSVRVYRVSQEGREQVLVRLGPGQAFNTVPVFQADSRNPANVVALTDVTLCALSRSDFIRLSRSHGDLAMTILRDFAGRLAHLTDLVESLALHSVQERLARFLIDQASASPEELTGGPGNSDEGGARGEVRRWTQQEIAVNLGTVRDVVGRELRALEEASIVRTERGRIILLDRSELERLAGR
jgi:CRP/FNR family cyclic AMP-dependent transcriptional regulator